MDDRKKGGETGLINTYFAPLASGLPGAFGLKDDAGCLETEDGTSLVLTADAIVEDVHYLASAAPCDIAYKALAVNVSDLCAKGAQPAAYLMTLALPPSCGDEFLAGLRDGFSDAQQDFGCSLLGGDTVRTDGPTVISITAVGKVPTGRMVHRSGARPGHLVYVTGTIGDAALGLVMLKGKQAPQTVSLKEKDADHLRHRYWRPQPRMAAISLVRDFASAAMDVSDGLVGDFAKLASASAIGGTLEAAKIPLSDASAAWLSHEPNVIETIMTGGDDYEILMTVPPEMKEAFESASRVKGVRITNIGTISSTGTQVCVQGENGESLQFPHPSYDHF